MPRARLALANLCVLLLALWLRLAALERLPIFGDEGIHLRWAQGLAAGQADYPWLMDGKALTILALAQLRVDGPGALWLARAGVAVLSLTGCAACIALGRRLGPRAAGTLAGALYAALPYAVFHERQVLADPLMACAGGVILAACLKLAGSQRQRWAWVSVVAAALAASVLFKLTGLFNLSGLLLAAVVVPVSWPGRRRLAAQLGTAAVGAGGLALLVVWGLGPLAGGDATGLLGERIGFIGCPPLLCQGSLSVQLHNSMTAAAALPEAASAYWSWPVLLLAALAVPLAPPARRREGIFLALFALSVLSAFLLAAKDVLAPRYYGAMAVPLAALAAAGLSTLAGRMSARVAPPWRRLVAAGLLSGVAVALLARTAPLVFNPARAHLPAIDDYQYRTGPFAGTGFPEAAAFVQAQEASRTAPGFVLIDHHLANSFKAYFDPHRLFPVEPEQAEWEQVHAVLAAGGQVYVVDEITADGTEHTYPRLRGEHALRVRAFGGLAADTLRPVFEVVFGQSESFRADYEALAAQWPAMEGRLAAYPPNQAAVLSSVLGEAGRAALIDSGGEAPWDPVTTATLIGEAAAEDQLLSVVFRDETRLDPRRAVETWLNTGYFRLEEQWFGALRLVTYAPSAPAGTLVAEVVQFEGGPTLATLELLDPVVARGGVARFRLVWVSPTPVTRAYKVFLHIFAGDTLAGQHDGQPVGELRPTHTWQPDEVIVDQFALRVSGEAPAGDYQLRVGLYDVESGARLPVRVAGGGSAEFWVGGSLRVE